MGSKAFLARSGVMIIEKGQVTMVASGSMASFATIENPVRDESYVVSVCADGACQSQPT